MGHGYLFVHCDQLQLAFCAHQVMGPQLWLGTATAESATFEQHAVAPCHWDQPGTFPTPKWPCSRGKAGSFEDVSVLNKSALRMETATSKSNGSLAARFTTHAGGCILFPKLPHIFARYSAVSGLKNFTMAPWPGGTPTNVRTATPEHTSPPQLGS